MVDMATSLCSENCVPEGARRGIVTQDVIVSDCFQSVNGTANDAFFVLETSHVCLPANACLPVLHTVPASLPRGCTAWADWRGALTFGRKWNPES